MLLPRLKQVLISDSFEDMAALGGVDWVLISDRHFGGPGCRRAGVHFDAPLIASDIEADVIGRRCKIDMRLRYERQTIDGTDIEAIPTPGHTAGQMAFLIDVAGVRCLFAGDFAWRSGGQWHVGNKSRKKMKDGIAALEDVDFDLYVGCADYGEEHSYVEAGSIGALADEIVGACTKP